MARAFFPILMGVVGVAVLIGLGVWQVERLSWKAAILARIDASLLAPAVAIPADPTEDPDEYLSVTATGDLPGQEIHVLTTVDDLGAGYRNIAVFDTDGRRILADLGFVGLDTKDATRAASGVTLTGNLLWPNEVDSWTPTPDLPKNIWFARDLPAMAAALNAEPVLLVVRTATPPDPDRIPLPLDTAAIPNDHLNYAITWFSLALVWAAMSVVLIARTLRRKGRA